MSGAQRRKIRKLSDGPDGDGDDMIEEAAGAALQALLQAQVGHSFWHLQMLFRMGTT